MQPAPAWEWDEEVADQSGPCSGIEVHFYWGPLLPRRRYWRSFLLSVAFHCLLIFGLPPLLDLLPESDSAAWRRQMAAMRALEIRVPERLYLSPVAPEKKREPLRPPRPKDEPKPVEVAKSQLTAPAPAAARPKAAPREFTPPVGIRRTNEDLTLI